MALDRRITIQRNAGMRDQHGEFMDDWQDVDTVWASLFDASLDRETPPEGVRTYLDRKWRIRWRSDVAALDPATTRVVDGANTLTISGISEFTDRGRARRRWLEIFVE